MGDPPRPSVVYALDARDAIVSVNEAWLAFAQENAAPELTRDAVLGRSLWDFVAGKETRELYEAIFDAVRTRDTATVIPFRCDSPDRFRFMQLEIAHRVEGELKCEAVLIREQRRPHFSILDQAFTRSDATLPICGFCKRVLAFGSEWLEPEDAVARLGLFDATQLPRLEHRVCDRCAGIVRDAAVARALH